MKERMTFDEFVVWAGQPWNAGPQALTKPEWVARIKRRRSCVRCGTKVFTAMRPDGSIVKVGTWDGSVGCHG